MVHRSQYRFCSENIDRIKNKWDANSFERHIPVAWSISHFSKSCSWYIVVAPEFSVSIRHEVDLLHLCSALFSFVYYRWLRNIFSNERWTKSEKCTSNSPIFNASNFNLNNWMSPFEYLIQHQRWPSVISPKINRVTHKWQPLDVERTRARYF